MAARRKDDWRLAASANADAAKATAGAVPAAGGLAPPAAASAATATAAARAMVPAAACCAGCAPVRSKAAARMTNTHKGVRGHEGQ